MTPLTIDTVDLLLGDEPMLHLAGSGEVDDSAAQLVGKRQLLTARLSIEGGRWEASFDLLVSRWTNAPRAPRSGSYKLVIGDARAFTVSAVLPSSALAEGQFRVAVSSDDGLTVTFAPPLTDAETGPANQSALESRYRQRRDAPINAIFFESFYGEIASCNPRAIDRAIARVRPDIARYWSVVDASVEVPAGAVALIDGSEEWWRIRGSARLIVVNDWLRKRFRKRRFQTVLQTWHGTMLKRIALGRSGVKLRTAIATLRERARWDIMLSQNDHSSRIFRTSYLFRGPIWQDGYPRNDLLVTGDSAAVRARLGVPADATVVLYAPTWRDDRPEYVDHLDVAAFTEALGPGFVTLVRGHARSLHPGQDVRATSVIDVTSYPDVSELFVAADALITDYSSVMFDFSVTGKPLFFFTPDLEHYRDVMRGFYFDLLEIAPGPVVQSANELVELVRDRDKVREQYADRYAAWQQRFNPHDDGRAAERVVTRLLERGVFSGD